MIVLAVFKSSSMLEAWGNQSAQICLALAGLFLMINLGKNYASWIVESDMSINVKNIGMGLVYVVAIMNYNELAGGFTNLMMDFTDQFSSAKFFEVVNKTGDGKVDAYAQMMKHMFDELVPLGAGDFFNSLGRAIRPVIETIQIVSIAVLYITGPIALAFSILLGSSVFLKWFNSLIIVIMWTVTMNLLETISIGLSTEFIAKMNNVPMTENGVFSLGLFWFVVQLMYLMVPFLTAKYINISSMGGIGGKLMAVGIGAAAVASKVGTGAASIGSRFATGAAKTASGGGGGSTPSGGGGGAASGSSSINNAITKQK